MQEKSFWKSKKFWAAIIGGAAAFARGYGIHIPEEVFAMIMTYIVGQGVADAGLGRNKADK